MIDLVIAVLASYLQSAVEWCAGVAPYVGAFGAVAIAGAFVVAILSGAMHRQNARVMEILERGRKANAKPQGKPEVWSI